MEVAMALLRCMASKWQSEKCQDKVDGRRPTCHKSTHKRRQEMTRELKKNILNSNQEGGKTCSRLYKSRLWNPFIVDSGIEPGSPALQAVFTIWAAREAHLMGYESL